MSPMPRRPDSGPRKWIREETPQAAVIVKKSFRIPRAQATGKNHSKLKAKIHEQTGSEAETQSILRSMDRMGYDASILAYEMTLEARPSRIGTVPTAAWRVRADRGYVPPPPAPESIGDLPV